MYILSMCDKEGGDQKVRVIGLENLSSGGRMPECVCEFCYLLGRQPLCTSLSASVIERCY